MAKHHLSSGKIFKLLQGGNNKKLRIQTLKELNESHSAMEEARYIVREEHGDEGIFYLNQMLKAQKLADLLGVEVDASILILAHLWSDGTWGN